ncbi:MAG: saccharopine dehydrogenase NADP-binding domain-containing protein [archaeon]|jgi:saccharopine dehydrogenase-like NADP-dependent oxidoreductase|nr:saccharopine dehydrogenase NADP-binding domain-containing protein [archaeon]
MKKPNLLILGASGGVANALLQRLGNHRNLFNNLILLDKRRNLLENKYIDHERLNYIFIHGKINLPYEEKAYLSILKKHKVDIVLDLTDVDSIPIIEATNKAKVSYINTAMNGKKRTVYSIVSEMLARKSELANAPNILCTGMNPGIANIWVRQGVEKFSVPEEIIHFEYDTSKVAPKWEPAVTWCINEFLIETVADPAGIMLGRGKIKRLMPNALINKLPLKPVLSPIMKLDKYPLGFTVLHEENITLANRYNIPSKFIYAVNMKTMEKMTKLYKEKKRVVEEDIIHGDNSEKVLSGADNIGVVLDYKDKKVYYFNSMPNEAIMGTNATYTQVIVGVFAALLTLIFDKVEKGINFPEDLYDTYYRNYIFDNLRTQEFVFRKKKGRLVLKSYNPQIRTNVTGGFKRIII